MSHKPRRYTITPHAAVKVGKLELPAGKPYLTTDLALVRRCEGHPDITVTLTPTARDSGDATEE